MYTYVEKLDQAQITRVLFLKKNVFDSFIECVLDIIDSHLSALSKFACLSSSTHLDFMSLFNQIY